MPNSPIPSSRPRGTGTENEIQHHRAVMMSSITKRPIDWLWKPFLQRRAINLLTGYPGVGKSTIVCEIVAALSRGRALPGDPPELQREPLNCWIMNGEDAADDTIVWRLENQGADASRVLITDKREVITHKVAAEIGEECKRLGIGLLVIDPLQAWMGKDVDMNKANETRDWGSALRELAMRNNLAVLLCRHMRKGAPGEGPTISSGLGSIDITGIARSELAAIRDKHDNTYIKRIKGTVGVTGAELAYTVERHPDPRNDHGILTWTGEYDPGVQSKAGSPSVSRTPKAEKLAGEWLVGRLTQGPVSSITLLQEATERGLSESTLRRAKASLGVVAKQLAQNEWVWMLGE